MWSFPAGSIERAIDFLLVGSGCPSECGGAFDGRVILARAIGGRVKTEELLGCFGSYYQEGSRSFY
ncbi:MAG: hypothetical protein JGK24_31965 [Microcoleus sp. PH2017_29_MFU_D_A]|uniref:hypothetical protein n=1 Tax=unclassified Microcoleus TaxID=2642155 RepID=UPI001DB29E89|nr:MULTISPECIES: hypothetical protein [unclassified Microcoleus]MCC3428812.1 hypothetical protein [Microcoleus sp. PH2017_04_SCI_O_A]MCC3426713.1 hypothetical protein [Microcoleus sp. PH2017_01_SCD_O_A]MCC3456377.1 hypothetical protein [Microcoleus sp. PH2017_08_TRC_O_A]MCC3607725.1 hypothetical protein [Microcoleus sp. PH2017_29_MFU_D_A]MCC3638815.1 hypothetical protein [Microcoleus sp. PH2017_37_MFU_D_B]